MLLFILVIISQIFSPVFAIASESNFSVDGDESPSDGKFLKGEANDEGKIVFLKEDEIELEDTGEYGSLAPESAHEDVLEYGTLPPESVKIMLQVVH